MGSNTAPKALRFHSDCYSIFLWQSTNIDDFNRLQTFASWRNPWGTTQFIGLHEKPFMSPTALTILAKKCGISPRLAALPHFFLKQIRDYTPDAPFWHFLAVLGLSVATSRTDTLSENLTSVPLKRVLSWERGQPRPITADDLDGRERLCLTLDSRGINSVGRLYLMNAYSNATPAAAPAVTLPSNRATTLRERIVKQRDNPYESYIHIEPWEFSGNLDAQSKVPWNPVPQTNSNLVLTGCDVT